LIQAVFLFTQLFLQGLGQSLVGGVPSGHANGLDILLLHFGNDLLKCGGQAEPTALVKVVLVIMVAAPPWCLQFVQFANVR